MRRVAGDGAAGHGERAAQVADGGGEQRRVTGDGAAGHGERADVVDTDAGDVVGRVVGDGAVPEGEGAAVVDAAAFLAVGVGDLAGLLAVAAVGDGQRHARVDLDGVLAAGTGDGLAVEAEVDVGFALPCGREGDVTGQVVVACGVGQAVCTGPALPRQLVAVVLGAPVHAADLVLVRRKLQAAAVGHHPVIRVVAEEARGTARPTHHNGASLLCRDTHGRILTHAIPYDDNLFASGKKYVAGSSVQRVPADSHVAREVKRTIFEKNTAIIF